MPDDVVCLCESFYCYGSQNSHTEKTGELFSNAMPLFHTAWVRKITEEQRALCLCTDPHVSQASTRNKNDGSVRLLICMGIA